MKTQLSALLLASLLVPGIALAGPGGPGGPGKGGPGAWHEKAEMIAKELGLSDVQKTQVREIRQRHMEQMKQTHEKLKAAHEDLRTAMKKPDKGTSYQKVLTDKFAVVQKYMAELGADRFRMAVEIRELLSPDQITKFDELHRKGRWHGPEMMHEGHDGPEGQGE